MEYWNILKMIVSSNLYWLIDYQPIKQFMKIIVQSIKQIILTKSVKIFD